MSDDPRAPFTLRSVIGTERDPYGASLVTLTVEWDGSRLSLTTERGQARESVRDAVPFPHDGRGDDERLRLFDLWERWHLNDMQAGCEHQERGKRLFGDAPNRGRYGRPDWYDYLRGAGLTECRTCGYSYGSAWRREEVPTTVLAELRELMDEDRWEIEAPDLEPDEVDEIDFPHADIIDSRELIAVLTDPGQTFGEDVDAEVEEAAGYAPDWNSGEQLIAEHYFTEYARQLADDIGAVNDDHGWPLAFIDWPAAADALKQDYTAVDIDGTTYYVR